MTNIEQFNNIQSKGSIGKRIYNAFDDTLKLDIDIYILELKKYLIRTKEYKKSDDKQQYIHMMIEYYQDYYNTMNKIK